MIVKNQQTIMSGLDEEKKKQFTLLVQRALATEAASREGAEDGQGDRKLTATEAGSPKKQPAGPNRDGDTRKPAPDEQDEVAKQEHRRKMNTIHSRRKRARQKIEIEVLREQQEDYETRNAQLRADNDRLSDVLRIAQTKIRLLELGNLQQHHSPVLPPLAHPALRDIAWNPSPTQQLELPLDMQQHNQRLQERHRLMLLQHFLSSRNNTHPSFFPG
jgi:hypothetical protein